MSPAEYCRQMCIRVGDTIQGREEWPGGWHDAQLTLLWIGEQEAVWRARCRSYKKPKWGEPFESVGWKLKLRSWQKI